MPLQENIQNNDLQLLTIPQLMKLHFFIPSYQRGYRWGEDQIFQLLADLWKYFKESKNKLGFYCLQPIVVKECTPEILEKYQLEDLSSLPEYENGESSGPKQNVWYEVIDGQQRLTTIRILLEFCRSWFIDCEPYSLRYATRPELAEIFNNLIVDARTKTVVIDQQFIYKNVDVEYVKCAAESIFQWFNGDDIEKGKMTNIGSFLANFYQTADKDASIQVIWYETKEHTDARDIFERLNNLKVPLSSSELIRALFLSDSAEYIFTPTEEQSKLDDPILKEIEKEDKTKKQLSINAKWDEIEHFFRNKNVWAFITNKKSKDYRNRIELLFDLMSQKYVSCKGSASEQDRLHTYLWFDKRKNDLWGLWSDVLKYYDTIRFWYENHNYYHKIGYLIHEEQDKILVTLLRDANSGTKKKSEFDKEVDDKIRGSIHTEKYFSQLQYDEPNDYRVLKSLLFLYNVEYSRQLDKDIWFPFSDYKSVEDDSNEEGAKQNSWTLEHIHAQNSQCLNPNQRKEWLEWIKYTVSARESIIYPSTEEVQLLSDLKKRLSILEDEIKNNTVFNKDEKEYDVIVELFQRDLDLWSGGKPYTVTHLLSNLALLSGDINSGLGKGSFNAKQQYINKCIADGKYVPICTQKVFLKHYYGNQDVKNGLLNRQTLTWDDSDREHYLDDIKQKLSTYFTPDKFDEYGSNR